MVSTDGYSFAIRTTSQDSPNAQATSSDSVISSISIIISLTLATYVAGGLPTYPSDPSAESSTSQTDGSADQTPGISLATIPLRTYTLGTSATVVGYEIRPSISSDIAHNQQISTSESSGLSIDSTATAHNNASVLLTQTTTPTGNSCGSSGNASRISTSNSPAPSSGGSTRMIVPGAVLAPLACLHLMML